MEIGLRLFLLFTGIALIVIIVWDVLRKKNSKLNNSGRNRNNAKKTIDPFEDEQLSNQSTKGFNINIKNYGKNLKRFIDFEGKKIKNKKFVEPVILEKNKNIKDKGADLEGIEEQLRQKEQLSQNMKDFSKDKNLSDLQEKNEFDFDKNFDSNVSDNNFDNFNLEKYDNEDEKEDKNLDDNLNLQTNYYNKKLDVDFDIEKIISISVFAKEDSKFSGRKLLEVFDATLLTYGDMNIFHRINNSDSENETTLFSVISAFKPGFFYLPKMREQFFTGITLFFVASNVDSVEVSINEMVKVAKQLAFRLDGDLLDQNRNILNINEVEEYKNSLKQIASI